MRCEICDYEYEADFLALLHGDVCRPCEKSVLNSLREMRARDKRKAHTISSCEVVLEIEGIEEPWEWNKWGDDLYQGWESEDDY